MAFPRNICLRVFQSLVRLGTHCRDSSVRFVLFVLVSVSGFTLSSFMSKSFGSLVSFVPSIFCLTVSVWLFASVTLKLIFFSQVMFVSLLLLWYFDLWSLLLCCSPCCLWWSRFPHVCGDVAVPFFSSCVIVHFICGDVAVPVVCCDFIVLHLLRRPYRPNWADSGSGW